MPDRATHPRAREGRSAPPPPRGRHEGEGGGVGCGGRRAAGATLLSLLLHPARPGPGHTGDGRRAPSASVRPPAPERGGGGRAARTRQPARGGARPGTPVPRSGERTGAGAPPRPARDGGGSGGDETGDGSGPRRAREARHAGARPRGAADGEGTEADGQTERGTDGMRPRGADTARPAAEVGVAARHREGNGPKRPGGGDASRPPGPAVGSHRHRPSRHRGGPAAPPGDDRLAPPPSRGSRPPPPPPPEPQPARGEHSPAAHRRPPHGPDTRGAPRPAPLAQGSEGTAPPGVATSPAEAGGRHPREARRGRLGPRRGDGNAGGRTRRTRRGEAGGGGEGPASTHGRGRGTGTWAPSGNRRKRTGHAAGPPGTPARDPTATRTRGRSRDAWGAGRPRPSPECGPRPGPAARAGEPSTRLPPSTRDRSVSHLSLTPEARHPGDNALERGGPDRDRTPPPAAARGARAGATGSPSPPAAGPGRPRPTGRRAPTQPPPSPRARTTGGRPHAHGPPPAGQRATHGTHTPPWRGPEGDTGLRETTPPLGLRHLRDDLERSRGTTEGHTRHAHTPAWGAQRGVGGGTALPATGRAARRAHAEKAKREQSAVSEDQRPPLTPRGKGDRRSGPEATPNPCLPHPP
ncbi:collagen alpha-1(III) chain-like [Capricornis sumatraensis]|uniref:collagen alpha-1(III) chain-like n=1 Tax=Capricornis sumatraensis TaxID=34865 RepID=UPI003604A62B